MNPQVLSQAVSISRGVLVNVTPDQLGNSTPCASWTVSGLINHMVGALDFFAAGLTGAAPSGETDYAAGDFLASFDTASTNCINEFSGEGVMEKMYTLPFGQMPGSAFIGLAITDTFTHAWDLAKALGQSTDLAPELAEGLLAGAKMAIPDAMRGPEPMPFAAQQTAPEDASNADKLAAFLGRTV